MIIRALSAQWFAALVGGLASFGLSVLVARQLGPDQFGVYAIAIAAGTIAAIVMNGGFGILLQRENARSSHLLAFEKPILPGLAAGHVLISALFFCFLAALFTDDQRLTAVMAVGFFACMTLNNLGLAVLRGRGRLLRDALWQLVFKTLIAASAATALWMGAQLPWQVLLAQGLGAGAFALFVGYSLGMRPVLKIPVKVYAVVLPLVWLELTTTIYSRSGFVLFHFLDVSHTDTGHFGIAFRIMEAIALITAPIGIILFRRFRLNNDIAAHGLRAFAPMLVLAMSIGALIAGGFLLLGPAFINLVFGSDYMPAAPYLTILGVSLLFSLPNVVLLTAALAKGMDRWCATSATLLAILNVTANVLLIPHYGPTATAWITVGTEFTLAGLLATGIRHHARQYSTASA